MKSTALAFFWGVLLPAVALAQTPAARGEPPTQGVAIPAGVLAGEADATAVRLNPANLGFLPAWNLGLLHTELDASGTRGGRGDAVYLATPVPYLTRWLAVGTALELVRPPRSFSYGRETQLSLALAVHPLRSLALGLTYTHVFGGAAGPSLDTFDLSVSARIAPQLACALAVRDIPSPAFHGLGIQRVYEPELTFRPLGNSRLEIAVAMRLGERRGDIDPRVRLEVRPWRGLVLRGALELKRDVDGDRRIDNDLRATVGIGLDFGRIGTSGYGLFGTNSGGGIGHGFAIGLRVSGDRYPSLITPRRLIRIDLAGGGEREHLARLHQLQDLLRRARAQSPQPNDAVLLILGDVHGSWATLEELRQAIAALRQTGMHVYAYGVELTTKSYYVASAAEKLWLDPAGGIRLVGISATSTYLRGTFDKLGVRAEFIKIAEYKSAPEQYTRTGPSDEAAAVRQGLLDALYRRLVDGIAGGRGLAPERVRALIDQGPYSAGAAMATGIVDGLKRDDEIEPAISELLGHSVRARPPAASPERPASFAVPTVAVLLVEGDIVQGDSHFIPVLERQLIGHKTLLSAILQARNDPRVRALVVRIDSPGGSALASDLIARELAATRQYKPVICSLGDVAASGGYFIASACDQIYALPSTITGSIGIFDGKFDLSGLAARLGVSWFTSKRGERADVASYWRPYTDEERAYLLDQLRYYYDRFVAAVSQGRKLTPEAVDAIGRGRVWTGAEARDRRLVDRLGGFEEAVGEAAQRAGLRPSEYGLMVLPAKAPKLADELLRLLDLKLPFTDAALVASGLAPLLRTIPLSLWLAPSTPQARIDPDLDLDF